MTDDPQWHAEGGHEQLDSAAYSAYKGKQVDLTTRPGFGEYSFDNFVEIMNNYPDLSGFWIDNDNEYWEQNGLYALIRQRRPSWLCRTTTKTRPHGHGQQRAKGRHGPPYDYPAAVWTPMPRLTEACYKLPSKGQWWFDGSDSTVDHGLNVGRFITNAGSSIKSLMAETAQVNGRFQRTRRRSTTSWPVTCPRYASRSTTPWAAATCTADCSPGRGTTAPTEWS